MTEKPQADAEPAGEPGPVPRPAKPRLLQDGRDMFWSLMPLVLGCILLAGLVESPLPAASLWPALLGLGVGLTLLLAFGLPPVLQLAQVPPPVQPEMETQDRVEAEDGGKP